MKTGVWGLDVKSLLFSHPQMSLKNKPTKQTNKKDCSIVGVRRRKDSVVEKLRGIEIRQANKTQLWKGTVGKTPERMGRVSSTPTTIT